MAVVPLLILVFFVVALVDIILRDSSQVKHLPKITWIFIVILLPLIGGVLWFALGREYPSAAYRRRAGRSSRASSTRRPRRPRARCPRRNSWPRSSARSRTTASGGWRTRCAAAATASSTPTPGDPHLHRVTGTQKSVWPRRGSDTNAAVASAADSNSRITSSLRPARVTGAGTCSVSWGPRVQ